jgi:hypothetical protein
VQQQRDNIEQFYDLLKCSKHVKREIQAVFKAFDANKDGSLNINEFRTYLKEPKERMPFLNRIFLTMDNDAMDGAERVNTYGVGELDMFEFFVHNSVLCVAVMASVRWRGARRWRMVGARRHRRDSLERHRRTSRTKNAIDATHNQHRSATTPSAPCLEVITRFVLFGTCTIPEGRARSTPRRSGV